MDTKISVPHRRTPWRSPICDKTRAPCAFTASGRCRNCHRHRPGALATGSSPAAALTVTI